MPQITNIAIMTDTEPVDVPEDVVVIHADYVGRTPTISVGVGMIFESVCLFVCLFVFFPRHNAKTNAPKVFRFGTENHLGYPRSDTVLGFDKGQGHRVNKCIFSH